MGHTFDAAAARAQQHPKSSLTGDFDVEQQRYLAAALAEINDLEIALDHRTVLGQATGMIMERYQLKPEAAVDVLRRLSQETNRKLYDIACELVASSAPPPAAA